MRIGFDVDSLTLRSGGIGRYAVNLINHIAKLHSYSGNEFFIFFHNSFDRDLLNEYSYIKYIKKYTHIKSNVLRKGIFLPFSIRSLKLNLFHGLDHVGIPFLYKNKRCKYVVTIHDLITKLYPEKFTVKHRFIQNTLLPYILKKADRIIAVSQCTKNEMIGFYPDSEEKVRVIYEGVESKFSPKSKQEANETLKKYHIDFPYFLFLGTLEPRKNIIRVLDAFIRLKKERDIDEKLVITGRKGWLYGETLKKIEYSSLSDNIVLSGFVDDDDLPSLYSGAKIFLYPSLFEGFGLPVLEAMACGVPVITSNCSSLPEIAGNAAMFVNPKNVVEIVNAMEILISNNNLREELSAKGLERAKIFSWDKTAKETIKLYEEIIE